ncbi:MAG: nucleoside deaminase, partial [Gammaproteobacteria bacterium]|nr:nucleoside deaminase [Gammaproteobacteria bacterium]
SQGNKLFGAALLRKSDLSTYLAETNNELENPLWHGEMHLLKRYYEVGEAIREPVEDLLFLSTHEPCSLCLSAITWTGFDNFYYFFTYQDSRDAFDIPHDLKILEEVFNIGEEGYRHNNAFWKSTGIKSMIQALKKSKGVDQSDLSKLDSQSLRLEQAYTVLSQRYQEDKPNNTIPFS